MCSASRTGNQRDQRKDDTTLARASIIENYDEINLNVNTDRFKRQKMVAQVADVEWVLLSAEKLAQAGIEVNFEQKQTAHQACVRFVDTTVRHAHVARKCSNWRPGSETEW